MKSSSNKSSNVSAADLRQQLATLEQQRSELEKVLDERRKEERKGFVDDLRQRIIDAGHDLPEIAHQLSLRRKGNYRRQVTVNADEPREYSRYVNPNNPEQRYIRGVLPGWMKAQMRAQGLDPTDKSHRERFKNESLRREN